MMMALSPMPTWKISPLCWNKRGKKRIRQETEQREEEGKLRTKRAMKGDSTIA